MNSEDAKRIAKHLQAKGLAFCFTYNGLVSREYLTEAFGITFTA